MFRLVSLVAGIIFAGVAFTNAAPVVIDANCQNYGIVATPGQVIENVTVKGAKIAAIQVEVDDVKIKNVTIEHGECSQLTDQYMAGIACWSCDRLTVEDSTITLPTEGEYGDGIWVKSASSQGQGGHRFIGNTIIGGYDAIGCETEDHSWGCFVVNTSIQGNVIRDCWDDGIQVEGRTQNVVVQGNVVSGCGTGIALAPSKTGPLTIEGNTLTDMRSDSSYGQQNCFKVGDGGSGTVTIQNNVCRSQGDGIQQSNSGLGIILHLRDNCFQVSRYVLEFSNKLKRGSSISGNTWDTSDPSRFVKYNGNGFTRAKWSTKFPGNTVGVC